MSSLVDHHQEGLAHAQRFEHAAGTRVRDDQVRGEHLVGEDGAKSKTRTSNGSARAPDPTAPPRRPPRPSRSRPPPPAIFGAFAARRWTSPARALASLDHHAAVSVSADTRRQHSGVSSASMRESECQSCPPWRRRSSASSASRDSTGDPPTAENRPRRTPNRESGPSFAFSGRGGVCAREGRDRVKDHSLRIARRAKIRSRQVPSLSVPRAAVTSADRRGRRPRVVVVVQKVKLMPLPTVNPMDSHTQPLPRDELDEQQRPPPDHLHLEFCFRVLHEANLAGLEAARRAAGARRAGTRRSWRARASPCCRRSSS